MVRGGLGGAEPDDEGSQGAMTPSVDFAPGRSGICGIPMHLANRHRLGPRLRLRRVRRERREANHRDPIGVEHG